MSRIRLAKLSDLEDIVDLLNQVTLDLHQKEINQWEYPWNDEKVEEEIKDSQVYVLTVEESVVGTFSIKIMNEFTSLEVEPESRYLYRIAVLPDYQGKGLGLEIVNYACRYVDELGKPLYLDCWAGNQKLRNFYSQAGFEFVGEFAEEDYLISVFKYQPSGGK